MLERRTFITNKQLILVGIQNYLSMYYSTYQIPRIFKHRLLIVNVLQMLILAALYLTILNSDQMANTFAAIIFIVYIVMCDILLIWLVKKLIDKICLIRSKICIFIFYNKYYYF